MDDQGRPTVSGIDPGVSTLALRSIAVLMVVAAVVGRGLSPALLGWKTGIGGLITLTDRASATLSQLVVVGGGFLAVRLLVPTLRDRELGLWYRLGVAPIVPAIVTAVFASSTGPLGPALTLALAVGTSALAVAAASASMGASETRAAGIVLALAGAGSFVLLVARVLAVRASDAALATLFSAARAVATVGFALDVAMLLLALLWLAARSRIRLGLMTAGVALIGAVAAWLAYRGAVMLDVVGSGSVEVLISRASSELVRHPRPLVPTVAVYGVEIAAFAAALVAAATRTRSGLASAAIALALGARMATDIPIHALALVLAALMAPLASASALRAAPPARPGVR